MAHLCPVCDEGHLLANDRTMSFMHGHKELLVSNQFHECDACGTEITLKEDARANGKAVLDAKQIADGRLTASEIRSIRKHLCLKQDVAGKIIGGGPTAFSKYEHSELAPTDAMDNLLWLLSEHEELIYDLAQRHGVLLEASRSLQQAVTVHGSVHSIVSKYSTGLLRTMKDAAIPIWANNIHPALCKGLTEHTTEAANDVIVSFKTSSNVAGCVA